MKRFCWLFLSVCLFACNNQDKPADDSNTSSSNAEPPLLSFSVVKVYPHDTTSFTEGLVFHDGQLFESTGSGDNNRYKSWAGPVDLQTGKPERIIKLDTAYFGEGISFMNGKLFQLTWENQVGFIYDPKTYKKTGEFKYTGEGWSLTHDSTHLIMTDGTSNIRYLDPNTQQVSKILGVQDNYGPVSNINEAEYVNGFIFANKWETNTIMKIDTASGKVVGKLDISQLDSEARNKYPNAQEANGIAYDPKTGHLFVTGKCWPNLYEIRLN
jgi:glutaminyl-peptide cyclotransferase